MVKKFVKIRSKEIEIRCRIPWAAYYSISNYVFSPLLRRIFQTSFSRFEHMRRRHFSAISQLVSWQYLELWHLLCFPDQLLWFLVMAAMHCCKVENIVNTVVCIIVRRLACLWSKMPMFQWAGMRECVEPLPLASRCLILMIKNLVIWFCSWSLHWL